MLTNLWLKLVYYLLFDIVCVRLNAHDFRTCLRKDEMKKWQSWVLCDRTVMCVFLWKRSLGSKVTRPMINDTSNGRAETLTRCGVHIGFKNTFKKPVSFNSRSGFVLSRVLPQAVLNQNWLFTEISLWLWHAERNKPANQNFTSAFTFALSSGFLLKSCFFGSLCLDIRHISHANISAVFKKKMWSAARSSFSESSMSRRIRKGSWEFK